MPDEVFEIWIAPLVASSGWPFTLTDNPDDWGYWSQYFGGQSVEAVNQRAWKRQYLPLELGLFHPGARNIIKLVLLAYTHRDTAALAKVKEVKGGKGEDSFLRSREFIKRTGRLYAPVILREDWEGYRIVDGYHRIAACFSLNLPATFALEAWIAEE